MVIEFPDSNYQLHLIPVGPISIASVGKRIVGTIRVTARRVDVVDTGGKYVEPIYGRPRRVQGRVVSTDAKSNTVTVDAGVPIQLKLGDARQTAGQFLVGELVSCDVMDGGTFEVAG